MKKKEKDFYEAVNAYNIPVLTLDHNWHKLFGNEEATPAVKVLQEELNELLKKQGRAATEGKKTAALKKKLMEEIIPLADAYNKKEDKATEKKIEEHKRLISECNEKLKDYRLELNALPDEIKAVNKKLMFATMDICYRQLNENTASIAAAEDWIRDTRIELKKQLIRKQEMEQKNQELYSYMHSIFGADVSNLFDGEYGNKESKEDG